MKSYYCYTESPIGRLLIVSDGQALSGLYMEEHRYGGKIEPDWIADEQAAPLSQARQQLAAYFAAELQQFSLPLSPVGTSFQNLVWQALRTVPYGSTTTYGELARQIGRPKSIRAVGQANARNPISIIIPCHRIIGADGNLTGYGGGLERKAALLVLEGVMLFGSS